MGFTMSEEQLLKHSNRMLRCLTAGEWQQAFPGRDLLSDEAHITLTCVQCGETLVTLARVMPKIERLGLQPICTACIEMRHALTGDGPIYGGTL